MIEGTRLKWRGAVWSHSWLGNFEMRYLKVLCGYVVRHMRYFKLCSLNCAETSNWTFSQRFQEIQRFRILLLCQNNIISIFQPWGPSLLLPRGFPAGVWYLLGSPVVLFYIRYSRSSVLLSAGKEIDVWPILLLILIECMEV